MPRSYDWQLRIKAVELRYAAAHLAISRLLETARRDPTVLTGGLEFGDVVSASKDLEGTYLIRLFAEFESGSRLYFDTLRDTNPRTKDLLDSLAALCGISEVHRDNAHAVREYRNCLVHERMEEAVPISIARARSYLCCFFSHLPNEW